MSRIQTASLILIALLVLPFSYYAAQFGQAGLRNALAEPHYLFSDNIGANVMVFTHMITGGAITFLVPFQLIRPLRQRFPTLHKWSGRIIICAAIPTAIGGLGYIATRGSIGGWPMDAGFTLYGTLTLLAAIQTIRHARAGQIEKSGLGITAVLAGHRLLALPGALRALVSGDRRVMVKS